MIILHMHRITEGAVRYHLRCAENGAVNGRQKKSTVEKLGLREVVAHWWQDQEATLPKGRATNVRQLWDYLVEEFHFPDSYKSVRKYVRDQFPQPIARPFRRIETPPGFKRKATGWK